jgi:hypothetical protein
MEECFKIDLMNITSLTCYTLKICHSVDDLMNITSLTCYTLKICHSVDDLKKSHDMFSCLIFDGV